MEVNLTIEKKDIKHIKEFLGGKIAPVGIDEIAYTIALFKTQDKRAHKVKIYDPDCEFKVNDLIYKEYPGKIPVGSKKYIEIDHGVVLKVVDTRTRFGLEEVKLSYEGTSEFKNYISYLERQKIELLLPHKQEKPPAKPEYLTLENDPRQQQAPLENRDFNILKKKLIGAFHKETDIAFISNKALLKSNLKTLEPEVFTKIREFLEDHQKSATTEFLVENFAKIKTDDPEFDSYCFSLNYRMTIDYKLDFQQTRFEGWGKWNLISVIYYMIKNSPISEENPLAYNVTLEDKKGLPQRRRKFEDSVFTEGGCRFYLTQREITAGAVKLKPGLFDFGDSIEIELIDSKSKKQHLVYYYADTNIMLGFKEIFEKYKALQGMILSFEQDKDCNWLFSIRTTKKGTVADVIEFDKEKKAFKALEEKIASPVFVNKAMFLEGEVFNTVFEKLDEYRAIDTLNNLVHKIFLEFGIKERNYEIHIQRLYHIVDLIFPVDIKMVEDIVLCNSEFVLSEKLPGVFYLDSSVLSTIEQEESQRQATVRDEVKKKKDEVKRKKQDEERRLKEEIRRKREERRKKREDEMWEKERLLQEHEEAPAAARPEPSVADAVEPEARRKPRTTRPRTEAPSKQPPAPIAETPTREPAHKKVKKKVEEERSAKVSKRPVARPAEEGLSEDEIKREIELEELKEKLGEQKRKQKKIKSKEVAYKDNGNGFGGVFASKLDEIVKKEDSE